jgi:sodium transport system permease protein
VNAAWVVFRKEAREMFRDRRVITGAFIVPVFLIALMMMLFGFLDRAVKEPPAPKLLVVDSPTARKQTPLLFPSAKIQWVSGLAKAEKLLTDGKAKLVLNYSPDFEAKLDQGGAQIDAIYDQNETLSQIALGQLREQVQLKNQSMLKSVLDQSGIPNTKAEAIKLVPRSAKGQAEGRKLLADLLPYLIVIWAFYGGFSTVSDMVAGEKERGTLETLLISPAHRSLIALGKFLALSLVCLISSLMTVVGLVLVRVLHLPGTEGVTKEITGVGPVQLFSIVLILVPLVMFFAGLLLAVSAAARNMREAQTYLTLVSFVVLMPAMFSQFIGFTDFGQEAWVKFTPILNSAMCIRGALNDKVDWPGVGITVAVSLVLAAVMLQIVIRLFNREQILTRV